MQAVSTGMGEHKKGSWVSAVRRFSGVEGFSEVRGVSGILRFSEVRRFTDMFSSMKPKCFPSLHTALYKDHSMAGRRMGIGAMTRRNLRLMHELSWDIIK